MSYWQQKATPWVTVSVLAGGMAASLILFFLVRVENHVQNLGYGDEVLVDLY